MNVCVWSICWRGTFRSCGLRCPCQKVDTIYGGVLNQTFLFISPNLTNEILPSLNTSESPLWVYSETCLTKFKKLQGLEFQNVKLMGKIKSDDLKSWFADALTCIIDYVPSERLAIYHLSQPSSEWNLHHTVLWFREELPFPLLLAESQLNRWTIARQRLKWVTGVATAQHE